MSRTRLVWTAALAALISCSTEPQTSYCEALCAQATTCAAAERPVDEAALTTACLDATHAANADCATAETDGVNAAEAKLLTECTDAIDESDDCSGFTGSIDELKTGAPPAECAGQSSAVETYQAAQQAVLETNAELCTRFSDTFCGRTYECVLESFGGNIPDDVVKRVGSEPVELCLSNVATVTDRCTSEDLYAPEASFTEANPARQTARECLAGVGAVTCDQLFSGEVPKLCAGAFSSPDDAAAFAGGLLDVYEAFQEAKK